MIVRAGNRPLFRGLPAAAVGFAVLLLVAAACSGGRDQGLSPERLAQEWVEARADSAGGEIAAWTVDRNALLGSLSVGWVRTQVNRNVRWEFSLAVRRSDGLHDVAARASVDFTLPADLGDVSARVPWIVRVDHEGQTVLHGSPGWDRARLAAPEVDVLVDEAVEEALEEVAEEVRREVKEALREAIDRSRGR